MERADQELLLQVVPSDERLRKLYREHLQLEKEVQRFELYAPYSPSAALRSKQLKKQKLHGMDSIMAILCEYREPHH